MKIEKLTVMNKLTLIAAMVAATGGLGMASTPQDGGESGDSPIWTTGCTKLILCKTSNAPNSETFEEVLMDGVALNDVQKSLVEQAIAKIELWETECGIDFEPDYPPGGGPPAGVPGEGWGGPPSEKLKELLENGSICIDAAKVDLQPTASTSNHPDVTNSTAPFVSTDPDNPDYQFINQPKQIGPVSVGLNSAWVGKPKKGADGEYLTHPKLDANGDPVLDSDGNPVSDYTFPIFNVIDLAVILLHESSHLNTDGTSDPMGFLDREEDAFHETIELLCAVVACESEEISERERKELCKHIEAHNLKLCFHGGTPKGCPSCTVLGISVIPPLCADGASPKRKIERLPLPGDGLFDGVASLDSPSGVIDFLVDGPAGIVEEQYDIRTAFPNFIATSFTNFSDQSLLVLGYDSVGGYGRMVEVAYGFLSPSFVAAYDLGAIPGTGGPTSISQVPGTRLFEFIDPPTGKVLSYNAVSGAVFEVIDFTDAPGFFDYTRLYRSRVRGPHGLQSGYYITSEDYGSPLDSAGCALSFVDVDGDGIFDFRSY